MGPRMATKWWGWGDPDTRYPSEALEAFLTFLEREGFPRRPPEPVPEAVTLPAGRLGEGEVAALRKVTEATAEEAERRAHARGQGYLDLVRARRRTWEEAPDAVAYPGTEEEVAALLRLAGERGWAVVPFGGGTSVLGGVRPLRGRHRAVVTLDLCRMNRVREVDIEARLVRAEAGIRGPDLEAALEERGLTLGHRPQSFHFSTLGGWIATRAVGHLSGGYGRIEDLVRAVRVVTPTGTLETRTVPARAVGPEVRELVLGSEGTLGIVVEAVLRVRPRPGATDRRAFLLPSFPEALAACRTLAQAGPTPALLRISDPAETRAALAFRGLEAEDGGCLVLLACHGPSETVAGDLEAASRPWTEAGGVDLGPEPVAAWEEEYHRAPYLRDELVARGFLMDTLETAAPWSRLEPLHRAVRDALLGALREDGLPGLVLGHVSHVYPDGASLYFTLLASGMRGEEEAQWHRLKAVATEAVLAGGGALSHHHGIGVDHRRWMEREHGPVALRALRALKEALDPRGILNPGKLMEEGS